MALNTNQKIALTGLSVVTVFIVAMWVVDLKQAINAPFAKYEQNEAEIIPTPPSVEQDLFASGNNIATGSTIDTDGDGLSDWDELNTYLTSPYLEDTDSDGIYDGDEVYGGGDPNCMRSNCAGNELESYSYTNENAIDPTVVASEVPVYPGGVGQVPTSPFDGASTNEAGIVELMQGNADPASIRQLLLESGVDKTMLSQISDQELMSVYKEVLVDSLPK